MRPSVFVVLVSSCVLAACLPKRPFGPRRLGDRLAAVGQQAAPIVMPILRNTDVKLVAKVRPAAPHAGAPQPEPVPEPVHEQPPPEQVATPAPALTVDRVNAARPTVFVLRGQTHGGQPLCETHTSSDECNTRCTSMLRATALTKPEPSTPKSCSCLEQDTGC